MIHFCNLSLGCSLSHKRGDSLQDSTPRQAASPQSRGSTENKESCNTEGECPVPIGQRCASVSCAGQGPCGSALPVARRTSVKAAPSLVPSKARCGLLLLSFATAAILGMHERRRDTKCFGRWAPSCSTSPHQLCELGHGKVQSGRLTDGGRF